MEPSVEEQILIGNPTAENLFPTGQCRIDRRNKRPEAAEEPIFTE